MKTEINPVEALDRDMQELQEICRRIRAGEDHVERGKAVLRRRLQAALHPDAVIPTGATETYKRRLARWRESTEYKLEAAEAMNRLRQGDFLWLTQFIGRVGSMVLCMVALAEGTFYYGMLEFYCNMEDAA